MRIQRKQNWVIAAVVFSAVFIWAFNLHSQELGVAQEKKSKIYQPKQQNLVYLNTDTGLIVIELAPFIAPIHVAKFKALVNEGFYNGLDFYRVIDGFVAQGGDVTEQKPSKYRANLTAEFTRPLTTASDFVTVQSPEFLAQETGFLQGFPAGRSLSDQQEWLLHCPGAVAMARNNGADSASTDFYIVIGQAPRHLDRNMSVFGQVIYGMKHAQAMQRGNPNIDGGVIANVTQRTKIVSAKLGHRVGMSQQINFTRNLVTDAAFQARLQDARTLKSDFFHYKGSGNLDICYYRPRFTTE
jgi:peptidylprolyl isomerase